MSVTEIGRRLKKARLDAGLTQKEVAQKLGITYQAISNYERGTNRVDTDTLTRLCQIYEIHIGDLLRTPVWDDDMFKAFHSAKSDEERDYYFSIWGCPEELIEYQNNRREPDPNPLSAEDERILYAYHRGLISYVDSAQPISSSRDVDPPNKTLSNIIRIAGRDGSYRERILTDEQLAALTAILEQMPELPEDL